MKHFLVVFDRSEGRVLREEPFSERSTALRARFQAERLHLTNPNIEVVVLSAATAEDLRKTHARYFQAVGSLAKAGLKPRSAAAEQAERPAS
jgi:hypothetical protein